MRRLFIPILVAALALGAGGWAFAALDEGYRVSVVLPSATNLIDGGSVMREGHRAGSIDDIEVANGKARVTLSLDDEFAPLHDGATVRIDWKSSLGERLLTVTDGPQHHPQVPNGGLIKGEMATPVEFDQVLSALDPATRDRLNSLVRNLDGTLHGQEGDVNATVRTAGPALQAIGSVLKGVNADGEAINQLVTQLNATMGILGRRDQQVEHVINALGDTTAATVAKREQLGQVLQRLPGTLQRADSTLREVPGMVDRTAPLLDDLRPATERLPSVARNLRPVLADLRPAVAELRPTLASTSELLRHTPGLLDSGSAAAPDLNTTLRGLTPTLDFLRPYTPELTGWLSNWGSATANYDANGHLGRIFIQTGAEAGNVNPGITSPGVQQRPDPGPGELGGQPGTDAFGGGMR